MYIKLAGNGQDLNTILAALRFYQGHGQGEPQARTQEIHDIATNGDRDISLDTDGIDDLCERINTSSDPMVATLIEGQQYGAPVYKSGCNVSECIAAIARTKTITPVAINMLKKMGYTVKVQGKPEVTL